MRTKTRKRLVIALIALLCAAVLGLGWIIFDATVDRSGWREARGGWYYRDFHGHRVTGWLETEYGRYYLGDDSLMVTGWKKIDGEIYWFAEDGTMATGWRDIRGDRFYFDAQGRRQEGWVELDGSRYYLNPALVSGWQEIDGQRRWFSPDGSMVTGWLMLDEMYYLDENGVPLTGKAEVDGSTYYFLEDGSCFRGWIDLEDGRYYFLSDGSMVTGWQELNGKRFYFEEDGTLATGWLEDGEYRYYLTADDGALTGAQILDDKAYYFTPDGIYVLLVNMDNPVPKSYVPELADLDGHHQVSPVCLEALRTMLTDCLKAGDEYTINNTYRSYGQQQDILKTRIERYMEADEELSYDDASRKALAEVARPGTSEHQTGLCMDINGVGVESCPWLMEHCWEYGFILRFPEGKEDITGIVYEPWHFRYVGTRVSIPLRDSGLCLEEYLGAA